MDGRNWKYDVNAASNDHARRRDGEARRTDADAFIESYVRSLLSGDVSVIPRCFVAGARPVWYQNGMARPTELHEVSTSVQGVFRWGEDGPYEGEIITESMVREDGVAVVFARFIEPGGLDFETVYMVVPDGESWRIATAMVRVMSDKLDERGRTLF